MTLAQRALETLEQIPSELFMIGDFTNGVDRCCSVGHLNRLNSDNPTDYSNEPANIKDDVSELIQLSEQFTTDKQDISMVNDGMSEDPRFQQGTPKQRVTTLLNLMIEHGC